MSQNFLVCVLDDERTFATSLRDAIKRTIEVRPGGSVQYKIGVFDDPANMFANLESAEPVKLVLFIDSYIAGLDDLSGIGLPEVSTQGGTLAGAHVLASIWPKLLHINQTNVEIALMSEFSGAHENAQIVLENLDKQFLDTISFVSKNLNKSSDLDQFITRAFSGDRVSKRQLSSGSSIDGKAIVMAASALAEQIREFQSKVRADNHFSVHNWEARDSLMKLLDELLTSLDELAILIPETTDKVEPDKIKELSGWYQSFKTNLETHLSEYASPENAAKSTVPLGIVLGCGTLGAILGGTLGFGAGSLIGQYITGHVKPGALSDRLNSALSSEGDTK